MTKEEIKQLTLELFDDFEDIKIRLGRIGKFNAEAVAEAYSIIVEVIETVEEYSNNVQTLSGEDKKAVAVEMLNDIIDIPWVPEFVEGSLIGWSVDLVVMLFNKYIGKSWIDLIFPPDEPDVDPDVDPEDPA